MQGEYSQLRTQLRPAVGIVAAVGIKTESLVWCIVTGVAAFAILQACLLYTSSPWACASAST